MTRAGTIRKIKAFWAWVLRQYDALGKWLDRIKWFGAILTIGISLSHCMACSDKNDLQKKIDKLTKSCKK